MIRRLASKEAIFVFLLAVVLLFGWLGSRGLGEPDEGRIGEISREMALQGDWLIPHLNGVPHFQKPPLTYWITAFFIRLYGPNEWAVRLMPALAALGTLLCTMYIAGVLYGKGCRWKAGLILLLSAEFAVVARIINTDMLLTFCITAAVAGLIGRTYRGHWTWLIVFYGCMGLGFLAKGPLGIVIPAITAVATQLEQKRHGKPVVRLYWGLGLPVALLIGLSWYVALIHHDKTLFGYFFRYEFIDRIASNTHDRSKPIWFYPGVLVVGLIPWTGFAARVLRDLWQRRRSLAAPNLWLFIGWMVVPYVILSLVVSKLATYLLPMMPPLAIVIARWLEHPATGERWRTPARISAFVLVALLLLSPALALSPRIHFPALGDLSPAFWGAMALATAALLLTARAVGRGLPLKPYLFGLAASWTCILLALASQADTLMTGGNRPLRSLVEHVIRLDPAGQVPVLMYKTRGNGAEFYLGRFVHRVYTKSDVVLPLEDELQRRIFRDEIGAVHALGRVASFAITKENAYRQSPEFLEWRVVAQDGKWILLASPPLASPPPPLSGGP